MNITKAKETAEKYCEGKGFSLQKLRNCYRQMNNGDFAYYTFYDEESSTSLINELESIPVIILKITADYKVLETENTKEYFES